MLRPLTYSLSVFAVAIGSWHAPVNANSLSLLPSKTNPQARGILLSQTSSQEPQNVPEVTVDTIPADEPGSSASSGQSDVVVDSDSSNGTSTPNANGRRFTCEQNNGQYTVMYNPQNQNQSYPWAIPQQMGGNWSPQKRCEAISQRLESYRPDGLLELKTSVKNGQDIVCATTQANANCRIVFTVPRGQDPITTRDRVFENLAKANQGQQTTGVTTYTNNSSLRDLLGGRSSRNSRQKDKSINLRPFLAPADGGTGAQLGSSSSSSSSPRLNPDLFR